MAPGGKALPSPYCVRPRSRSTLVKSERDVEKSCVIIISKNVLVMTEKTACGLCLGTWRCTSCSTRFDHVREGPILFIPPPCWSLQRAAGVHWNVSMTPRLGKWRQAGRATRRNECCLPYGVMKQDSDDYCYCYKESWSEKRRTPLRMSWGIHVSRESRASPSANLAVSVWASGNDLSSSPL